MSNLINTITENAIFILEFFLVIALMFVIAYAGEKIGAGNRKKRGRVFTTKKIAVIGVFSAISVVLHIFDIAMPFAPSFYKLDLSEIPVLICSFAMGPVAGVMTEVLKIILKLIIKGTSTAFVGDLANFTVGCSFILPAAIIYQFKKSKKTAVAGCVAGTVILTVFGSIFNGIYLLPKFAELYGMPLDAIIGMGSAINPAISNVTTFVIFAVAPINIIKGLADSIITVLIYKKISTLLHKIFSE